MPINKGVEQVEGLRPELETSVLAPKRELPEDRNIEIPVRGCTELIAARGAIGI